MQNILDVVILGSGFQAYVLAFVSAGLNMG